MGSSPWSSIESEHSKVGSPKTEKIERVESYLEGLCDSIVSERILNDGDYVVWEYLHHWLDVLFVYRVKDHLVSYADTLLVIGHVEEADQQISNYELNSVFVQYLEGKKQDVVSFGMHSHVCNVVFDVLKDDVLFVI